MTHPYYCDVDKSPPSKENLCAYIDVHLVNSLFIICSLWKYKDLIVMLFLIFLAYLRARFIINGFLFLQCSCFLLSSSVCNLRCLCVFCSHVKCQNRKLFWGVGFLQEVLSPKRQLLLTAEGKEKTERESRSSKPRSHQIHTRIYIQN